MESDLAIRALQFAIETTKNCKTVEDENKALREQLKKNLQLLNDYEEAAPRAKILREQLKVKEQKLENKRKELIELQDAIISTLKSQKQPKESNSQESLAPIPIVMNRIQQLVMNLSETAVDQKTTAVPILSLFKASDALNQLFDALVEQKIIEEGPQEREARIKQFVSAQQQVLEQLKKMIQKAEEAPEEEEFVAEEEEEGEPAASPKIEEVVEVPEAEVVAEAPKTEDAPKTE